MATKRVAPSSAGLSKAALATGSLSALSLLSFGAQAGEIHVTGSPVSPSLGSTYGTSVAWDVDGAGGVDFHLRHIGANGAGLIFLGNGGLNGQSMVVTSNTNSNTNIGSHMEPLAASFHVGPTLAAGFRFAGASDSMGLLFSAGGVATIASPSLHAGVNHIGFDFMSGGNTLYGFANLDLNISTGVATITDWTYNDTPGGSVHVVDATTVPEPSTLSLALIGMGAGGVRAWRKRRQALAA